MRRIPRRKGDRFTEFVDGRVVVFMTRDCLKLVRSWPAETFGRESFSGLRRAAFRHFRCSLREAEKRSDKFGQKGCVILHEYAKVVKCQFHL